MTNTRVGNLSCVEEWPPNAIRIDRDSIWGNPYRSGWVEQDGEFSYRTREKSISMYRTLMETRVAGRPGPVYSQKQRGRPNHGGGPTPAEVRAEAELWIGRLESLQGRLLLCWCTPDPCHGNVLVEMSSPERLAYYRMQIDERERKATQQREHSRLWREANPGKRYQDRGRAKSE